MAVSDVGGPVGAKRKTQNAKRYQRKREHSHRTQHKREKPRRRSDVSCGGAHASAASSRQPHDLLLFCVFSERQPRIPDTVTPTTCLPVNVTLERNDGFCAHFRHMRMERITCDSGKSRKYQYNSGKSRTCPRAMPSRASLYQPKDPTKNARRRDSLPVAWRSHHRDTCPGWSVWCVRRCSIAALRSVVPQAPAWHYHLCL